MGRSLSGPVVAVAPVEDCLLVVVAVVEEVVVLPEEHCSMTSYCPMVVMVVEVVEVPLEEDCCRWTVVEVAEVPLEAVGEELLVEPCYRMAGQDSLVVD